MIRYINRFLKIFGLQLAHARRPKVKVTARFASSPDSWDLKDGQTHSYGDSCPGGHYNDDLTDTCERPRVEQPKSNPDITGPTS